MYVSSPAADFAYVLSAISEASKRLNSGVRQTVGHFYEPLAMQKAFARSDCALHPYLSLYIT